MVGAGGGKEARDLEGRRGRSHCFTGERGRELDEKIEGGRA